VAMLALVGVEASNFTANSGYFDVHYHVDV
jgi:hypothetical protein